LQKNTRRLFLQDNLVFCLYIYSLIKEFDFMKHMIQWAFSTDTYERGMKQFLETGGPDPEGVRTIGRWHAPGTMYGFHLVEADPANVTKLTSQWASLVDLTITPVIDDDEAKKGLSATF
jgi:hypothetical protein